MWKNVDVHVDWFEGYNNLLPDLFSTLSLLGPHVAPLNRGEYNLS